MGYLSEVKDTLYVRIESAPKTQGWTGQQWYASVALHWLQSSNPRNPAMSGNVLGIADASVGEIPFLALPCFLWPCSGYAL